jgi:hypothetical protein
MSDTLVITLKRVTCVTCGMVFGMPEGLYDARNNDHEVFWCVACGQSQNWSQESEWEKSSATSTTIQNRRRHEQSRTHSGGI